MIRGWRLMLFVVVLLLGWRKINFTQAQQQQYTLLTPGLHVSQCWTTSSPYLCGSYLHEQLFSASQVSSLLSLADAAFSLVSNQNRPVCIFDMISGALTQEDKFINLFRLLQHRNTELPLDGVRTYLNIIQILKQHIRDTFNVSPDTQLFLTRPSFFSKIRPLDPAVKHTIHDEYWHRHIDREQYGTFAFTALIYLNQAEIDFTGGEFVFLISDSHATQEPQAETVSVDDRAADSQSSPPSPTLNESSLIVLPFPGRVLLFSSGPEHPHYVRPVLSGTRYALTIAFTTEEEDAVQDTLKERYPDIYEEIAVHIDR